MLAPAVAAGKGVKGERECRRCLRFLLVVPPCGTPRNYAIVVARPPNGGLALSQLAPLCGARFLLWRNFRRLVPQ
jgi:hypothetical protein